MKRPIDESIIRNLQEAYYNEEPRAMTMMYCETRRIASILLASITATKCIVLSNEKTDQIVHDASSRFVSQYMKHPGYWVDKFTIRIRLEVIYFLFDGGHHDRLNKVAEKGMVSLDTIDTAMPEIGIPDDRRDFVRDLHSEHVRGTDILLAIMNESSFRRAVLAVSCIAGKAWCYDRAVKLREVYRMTRRRNGRVHVKREKESTLVRSGD